MKMRLVSDITKTYAKLINRNTFRYVTMCNENLAAIHLEMNVLKFGI